jgi:trk system potassium uptake protein TrkH
MSPRGLTLQEAVFTATSALSVTGLSTIVPARDLTVLGQLALLCLIQTGGVGFMVIAVIILRLLGRKVSLTDRLALTDSLGLLNPRAIVRVVGRSLLVVGAIEGAGTLLLWLHWRSMLGDGKALFYGLFHAVSSFCNAGFDLFSGAVNFETGLPSDAGTQAIMGTLIILGGLGIPVLGDLLFRRGRYSLHTRITLVVSAILIVGGGLGIFLAENRNPFTLSESAAMASLRLSFFQSISTRTAGFAGLPNFELLTPATQWLMTGLMLIGTAPASMGGGITTGTFAVLVLALWSYARGLPTARIGGRTIAPDAVRRAAAILTVSVFTVGIATWLILIIHPQASAEDALFTVVSAFATTGLSLELTGELNFLGEAVLMVMMFWGRLGALTIIIALARQRPPQPVTYPEEPLLIG